jgi:hypothetical protein
MRSNHCFAPAVNFLPGVNAQLLVWFHVWPAKPPIRLYLGAQAARIKLNPLERLGAIT